jgi:uroporphyrinogen-III synthase
MQDDKPYILSTQPLQPWLVDKAAQRGIVLDCLCFVETKSINDACLKEQILGLALTPLIAVFTSTHAVETVRGLLEGKKPAWTIFCTGPVTSNCVNQYFGEAAIAGVGASASDLVNLILEKTDVKELVFFCGNRKRGELPEKLFRKGITVRELEVYQTVNTPQRVSKHYEGISFFSPSAVHSFFSVNTIEDNTLFFAIGKSTADTIAGYSRNTVIQSKFPDKELLIEQAIDCFSKINPLERGEDIN